VSAGNGGTGNGGTGIGSLSAERTPSRPGPGPTPDALLRALDLTVRRRVEGLLAGEHRSAALGVGTELAQVREYQPGDDVRRMDWNVTARTGEPHVRVQVAERILVTWLVLDTSPSMQFGTADRRKADVAEGVGLALGHTASRRGNRLGVMTFGGNAPTTLPPRQGRVGLLGVLSTLRREPGPDGGGATSIGAALGHVSRVARSRAFVAVVSDFRGPRDWRLKLLELAGRHDVVAVEIRDPREMELPDVGDLWTVDPETGRQLRVDTGNRFLRARFAKAAAAEREEVAAELRAAGIDHVVLSTAGDWLRDLVGFLKLRAASPAGVAGAPGAVADAGKLSPGHGGLNHGGPALQGHGPGGPGQVVNFPGQGPGPGPGPQPPGWLRPPAAAPRPAPGAGPGGGGPDWLGPRGEGRPPGGGPGGFGGGPPR
jgi:Mg-chelatase subunit ChlD